MNKRIAPLLAFLLAAAACAPKNNIAIEIFETCYPPTPDTTTGACLWPAACTAEALGGYFIDIGGTDNLFLGVQVNNNLADNSDPNTGKLNTNDAFVDTFTVTYDGVDIPAITGPVQIQNTVPTSGNTVVGVNLLQLDTAGVAAIVAALAAKGTTTVHVVAHMKLHGVFQDQSKFDTGERVYGVDICDGCMTAFTCVAPKLPAVCPHDFQGPAVGVCITPS
jgi:hypothetical protein